MERQQEREIKRLKEILFPKNKSKVSVSTNMFEQKTKRQQQSYQQKTSKQKQPTTKNNNSRIASKPNKLPLNERNTNNHPIKLSYGLEQQSYKRKDSIEQQKEKHKIKNQIDRLKSQISTMLSKCNDEQQQLSDRSIQQGVVVMNEQLMIRKQQQQNMTLFQTHHQHLTRQHYLNKINQITQNLQKYNAYMYGIKQAAQQMIHTVPTMEDNYLIKLENVRAFKLYYLGKVLMSYFGDKIELIRKERLRAGMQRIKELAELMDQERKKEKQRIALNKGNHLFLRKNLLDKAFKKWRTNAVLLKFKDTLNEHLQPQIIGQTIPQVNGQIRTNDPINTHIQNSLKDTQFLCKNILNKQSIILYLQQYLLEIAKKIQNDTGIDRENQILTANKQTSNVMGGLNYLSQEIQILFVDQNSSKVFSYINQYEVTAERQLGNVSQSRLLNVLETVRQGQEKSYQSYHEKSHYKKYSFGLKNSLTRMCIDSSKIIRLPDIRRNEVFSLQVDGSIGQQLWIKTAKTQRGQQKKKNPQQILSKMTHSKQQPKPIITEQVFYQQHCLINQQGYHYECSSIKSSAIFYPLIHENTLVGIIRQYIYHSSPISVQQFELPFQHLQFVTESVFSTFELTYSFERLKKERRLIENGYALRVVRVMRRVEDVVDDVLKQVESEEQCESGVADKMMKVFASEMSKFLSSEKLKSNKLSSSAKQNTSNNNWHMTVYQPSANKQKFIQRKSVLVYQDNLQADRQEQFEKVFSSDQLSSQSNDKRRLHHILCEFHQSSRHKQSNIMQCVVSDGQGREQSSQRIILLKPTNSSDGLYFCFTQRINNNQHQTIPLQSQHSMPPQQLIVDIVNKFTSTLSCTLQRYKQIKHQLAHKLLLQRQMKKEQIKQHMRVFYLDSIKQDAIKEVNIRDDECFGEEGKEKVANEQRTYLSRVNAFIITCVNKLYNYLIDKQTPQQSFIIAFSITYTLTISMPRQHINDNNNNKAQQLYEQQKQVTCIKVSLNFRNCNNSNSKTIQNNLYCDINYDVMNHYHYQCEQQQAIKENHNQITLALEMNNIAVEITVDNETTSNITTHTILTLQKQEINYTLKEIINNYFTFSKETFTNQYLQNNYISRDGYQMQEQEQRDNQFVVGKRLTSIADEIIPAVRAKLLQQYLMVGNKQKQTTQQQQSNTLLQVITTAITHTLSASCISQPHLTINKQNIMQTINMTDVNQSLKRNNKIIQCRYYQFLSQRSVQLYQRIVGGQGLFERVITKLESYDSYRKRVMKYNKDSEENENSVDIGSTHSTITNYTKSSFNSIINSSYFFILSSTPTSQPLPLINIILKHSQLQHVNIQKDIAMIEHQLSRVVENILHEHRKISRSNQFMSRMNRAVNGFITLVEGKQKKHQVIMGNEAILYKNISIAFNTIKHHSHYIAYKATKLLSLSHINKRSQTITLINSLRYWQQTTKYITNQQLTTILKQKIVNNLQQSKQNLIKLTSKIGTICCYDKVLGWALRKMIFYAKHERIVDFGAYRLKFMNSAMEKLQQVVDRSNRVGMKRFYILAVDEMNSKRKQQSIMQKRTNLSLLQFQYSKAYNKLLKPLLSQALNMIKLTATATTTKNSLNHPADNKLTQQQTLDDQLTQSHSLNSLTSILKKEFPQYDIWIKPSKNRDEFFVLALSSFKIEMLEGRNVSFDETTIVSSRVLNETLEGVKVSCAKLTKDEVYQLYENNNHQFAIMQTSQAIFICRDIMNVNNSTQSHQQQPSFITQHTNLATQVVTLFTTTTTNQTQLPFKQKQKLISLSKYLQQFFTHYKIQLNTKILHIQQIYESMRNKRYRLAMKRWKKYDQNLMLIKQYQLTDTVYELNIQTENLREKIKQQDKQINDNQIQYSKLAKKQQQQRDKIIKYQNNIEVLNKMLQSYQKIQRRQQEYMLMRSGAKSSSAKRMHSKMSTCQYYHRQMVQLSHEEMGAVLLSLTRWRQINANEKLKQLRVNNFMKQITILNRCVVDCQKSIKWKFTTQCFKKLITYTQRVKRIAEEKQKQERQKQRVRQLLQIIKKEQQQRQKEKELKQAQRRQKENMEKLRRQLELETENNKRQSERLIKMNSNNINDTPTQSLRDQLQSSFSELNRRLVTFQKNHFTTNQDQQLIIENNESTLQRQQKYIVNSQVQSQLSTTQNDLKSPLELFKHSNNNNSNNSSIKNNIEAIDIINKQMQKMTQEEKIKFELERMRMKKLQFNKENLTVTKEEYDRLNGGNGYKLGGKTLRFLKRMGKLQTSSST